MGGLGKTTLVKKVYDDKMVSERFDCHAWIAVSHSYKMENLLRSMIKQFYRARKQSAPRGIDTMEETVLISILKQFLQPMRYVVAFDDVWTKDFWRYVKHALPNNNRSSRIIITTRINDVAVSCNESSFDQVYKLQPLPQEKAWELFRRKAFQSCIEWQCPQDLEKLSWEILKICEGLPIAIVTIGSLLSTKDKDVFSWQTFLDSLGSELKCNPYLTCLTKILLLSYHDLPCYLKSCLLYLGVFPKDYPISCVRLIREWVAEGFVKPKKGKTLEEVAEEYLTELINRSLIQESRVDLDGKARNCHVHPLMRKIILSKSEELNFSHTLEEEDSSFNGRARRLSIYNSTDYVPESIERSQVCSIFLFELDELPKSFTSTFFRKFRLLRVLDFQDAPMDYIPENVGNLFHLRYLSLRNTDIQKLSKSIGKLYNLETLDLKDTLVSELPMKIKGLCKLRHLLVYYFDDEANFSFNSVLGVKTHAGIKCLQALQKLYFVEANHGSGLVKELGKLGQLRKLGITELARENGKALCESFEKLRNLVTLDVSSTSEDEIIDLQSISSPPQFLRHLYLKGHLEKLPEWIPKLQNLFRLRLCWSGLTDDPLRILQTPPNLLELGLYHAYDGEQLHFQEGGFKSLKMLSLRYLDALNSVTIDEGALPILGKLDIGPWPQLQEVPSGIPQLKKITTLQFYDMPREFVLSMDPGDGRHFHIVRHVPTVLFHYVLGAGRFDTYTLWYFIRLDFQ